MYNIIAIMGKAGAGKDALLNTIAYNYSSLNKIISFTTRPIRENEVDGVDYHFISKEEFYQQRAQNVMLEYTEFRKWFYGTSLHGLKEDTLNIGVFNPAGVEKLRAHPDVNVYVVYVTAKDKTRLLRQLNREENPDVHEIVRRFTTDEKDFENISQPYFTIWNDDNCYSLEVLSKEVMLYATQYFGQR